VHLCQVQFLVRCRHGFMDVPEHQMHARAYDKQLQPGQYCPLCSEQAKEFNFSELGDLWKQKWEFKKSVERAKKQENVLRRKKFCPKCGSTNINFAVFYRPSIWRCLDCGYEALAYLFSKSQNNSIDCAPSSVSAPVRVFEKFVVSCS
jgi:ribosomal protein L37AE/L43A